MDETEIDNALLSMCEDISAAHEFTTAIARLTETLDPEAGLVFQRIAGSAINHINNIQRQVDELRQGSGTGRKRVPRNLGGAAPEPPKNFWRCRRGIARNQLGNFPT